MARVIFFGTPDYAVPFFEALCKTDDLKPIAVVSQPDRPIGRKQVIELTPIKRAATSHEIPVLQFENVKSPEAINALRDLCPDVCVVVAFGQIISAELLAIPRKGFLNVHPSLLPRHRGASPLQETILQGDRESAVTIMLMDEKMDHGPILSQELFSIDQNETLSSLQEKTHAIGRRLLLSALHTWLDDTLTPRDQDHNAATYTRLLTKGSGAIDWNKSALEIDRQVRAFNPWPGTWTVWNEKRLRILKTTPVHGNTPQTEKPGDLFAESEGLFAACGAGTKIRVHLLQLEGKKAITDHEFIKGYFSRK